MTVIISELNDIIEGAPATANKEKTPAKKAKGLIKKRSKDEVIAMYRERMEMRKEKEAKRDSWQKFWEKEDAGAKRGFGGNRRPKTFRTDHLDEDADFLGTSERSYKGPLSKENSKESNKEN